MDDAVAGQNVKVGDEGAAGGWLDGDELWVTHGGDLLAAGGHQRVAARSNVLTLQYLYEQLIFKNI